MHIKGRTWTFGRNVNTDLIYPKVWFRPTYEPGEMASHLMVGIDEEFPRKVRRGDLIVGAALALSSPWRSHRTARSVEKPGLHFTPAGSAFGLAYPAVCRGTGARPGGCLGTARAGGGGIVRVTGASAVTLTAWP